MAAQAKSTQNFIPIKEIRDGVVVLKDNSMRMVLMVSSINFALKSEEEKAGTLMQFQNFLNSLEFSTQIYIQSRRLDIKPYLATLNNRLKDQITSLMRIQIEEYIQFIKTFTDETNIMTKSFFVIIPYSTIKIPGTSDDSKEQATQAFENARSQLNQRANIIRQGLIRSGLRVMPLGTDEVVELYYRIFNPTENVKGVKV